MENHKEPTTSKPAVTSLSRILNEDSKVPFTKMNFLFGTAEAVIQAYEKEGQRVLKAHGYSLAPDELAKMDNCLPDYSNACDTSQVYSVKWMLYYLEKVRYYVQKNNTDRAIWEMATALEWAFMAKLKPLMRTITIGGSMTTGRANGFQNTVLKKKEIREAFARHLVKAYSRLNPSQLTAKIHEKARAIPFTYDGATFQVYRITKKARTGTTGLFAAFEANDGKQFTVSISTLEDTIRAIQKSLR